MNVQSFLKLLVPTWFLLTAAIPAGAAESGEKRKEIGTFEVKFENDLFSGADQHYTNGIRFSYLSPEGNTFEPLQYISDLFKTETKHTKRSSRIGMALGHEIYTPQDRYRTDLIVYDRPYAGWLYGGLSLHTVIDWKNARKDLESIELDVGVVGPSAYGEQIQNYVHKVRLIDPFDGWGNQLKNELGVALHYERKWRFFHPVLLGPLEFDAIPHAGVSLGNVVTQSNVGGALRWGKNLPRDFGPPSLIQAGTTFDRKPDEPYSVFLFATAEGRYVAHNIFLDGNTFRDSHRVDKKNWIGDLSLGVAFLYGRFKISYANAFRTKEYKGQPRISRFGSITASYQF